MKRLLILTLAALFVPAALAQKPKPKPQAKATKTLASVPPSGIYEGALSLPNTLTLRLVFHFDGKGGGTWDSPDQNAMGLRLTTATATDTSVTVTSTTPPWRFTGTRSADGASLTGTFEKAGGPLTLRLKRVAQATQVRRPQTPKAPFPYKTVEVSFPYYVSGNLQSARVAMAAFSFGLDRGGLSITSKLSTPA